MTMPTTGAQWPHVADDTTFDGVDFDQTQPSLDFSRNSRESIDFGASQAFFGGFQGTGSTSPHGSLHHSPAKHVGGDSHQTSRSFDGADHSPVQRYRSDRDTSPRMSSPAVSGLDPISKLGFNSNRPSPQHQPKSNSFVDTQYFPPPSSHQHLQEDHHQHPHQLPHHNAQPQHANLKNMQPHHISFSDPSSQAMFSPHSAVLSPESKPQHHNTAVEQRRDDTSYRIAEIERRNRLREEDRTRRVLEIQKRVQDGLDAVQLEKDDAAHRSAEVERRNRQREEEKEKRRLAVQKQVEDGIKAIHREKQRQRAQVEADRAACRKWLSDLTSSSSSTSSTPQVVDAAVETIDLYAAVGRQLRGFWESSRPGAASQKNRNEVIADVQRAIDRKYPGQGLQVAAFGSSVTGLLTESSDLDLVLLDPARPCGVGTPPELRREPNDFVRHTNGMPEWYNTKQIANAIRNSNKFTNIVSISTASVPIVKMVHRKFNIPADINVNERFGLFNSQLIQAYANVQPAIVRPLIFFLKHWYSQRDLNDPAGKRGSMTFSSYTIALMALQVLQVEGILPNLQSPILLMSLGIRPDFLYARFKQPRRGKNASSHPIGEGAPPQKYNVTFATGQMDLATHKARALQLAAVDLSTEGPDTELSRTDRLLGRMLVAFIRFYTQLDRRRQVVSVINGSPLERSPDSHPRHVLFDTVSESDSSELNEVAAEASSDPLRVVSRDNARASLCEEHPDIWAGEELVVQDPFIVDRNTSRNIKSTSIERWQSTMEGAAALLGLGSLGDAGLAPRVRLRDAPLILDLCVPDAVRHELEAAASRALDSTTVGTIRSPVEPWKAQEEAAAIERQIAKQAADSLRKEKKKQARRAKAGDARRLQEEAAMVEDMIDGMEGGRVTGTASKHLPNMWRLRQDADSSTAKEPPTVPFTFSVSRPSGSAKAPTAATSKTEINGDASKQHSPDEAAMSPTLSSRTDGSSESEDIDLVALRLEQSARVAVS